MPRRIARAVALIVPCLGALVSSSISPQTGQTVDPPARLEPGRSIERTLGGRRGASLRAHPDSRANAPRYPSLQRGLDVVVRVVAPDGTVLGEFDDEARDGRDEQAEVVAVASGIHTADRQSRLSARDAWRPT